MRVVIIVSAILFVDVAIYLAGLPDMPDDGLYQMLGLTIGWAIVGDAIAWFRK